jgi:nucleoside-diphosphate-sugar epimerase
MHPRPSTFSIAARDPETDAVGVAVQSKFVGVGAVVPFASADAGAIATQSFAPETRNEAYNLANPEPVTMKELARRIFALGRERGLIRDEELEFEHIPIYEDDVKERMPAVEKARNDFGWKPEVKLDDALERYIDHIDELYDMSTPAGAN